MMSCGIEVLRGFEKLVIASGGCLLGERLDRHLWISDVLLRRSEEHTSELQSHHDLVCRLLLEKKINGSYAHIFLSGAFIIVPWVHKSCNIYPRLARVMTIMILLSPTWDYGTVVGLRLLTYSLS